MKTVAIAKTIQVKLNQSTSNSIVVLTNNNLPSNLNSRHRIISRNKFVNNLKAYSTIKSIPESEIPNFSFEDTETEKLNKVLDIEWKSARKQLNLLLGSNDSNDYMSIGEVSLLNPTGYPYRIHNLLDLLTDNLSFELGDNAKLSVKIEDVGYGLLGANDTVSVYGSYIEELVIDDSVYPITNTFENIVNINNETKIVLSKNENRKYCLIQNNSENNIYLSLSEFASSASIKILPNGHFDFDTSNVAYYGDTSVFSDYNADVLVMECS